MDKLKPINALFFCLKAVRSVSGNNGSNAEARKAGDIFVAAYEAHQGTSAEAIPVAGLILGQFFTSEANLSQNSTEILLQAKELATDAGFLATKFEMNLKRPTALGAMAVVFRRQNQSEAKA